MLPFPFLDPRKALGDGEPSGIAGVDTGDERLDEPFGDFGTEPAREERSHRFGSSRSAADERLPEKPQLASRGEKLRREERPGRHRKGLKTPAEVHVARSVRIGQHRFLFEAETDDEVPQRRRGPDGVGTKLEQIAAGMLSAHDAAGTRRLFEKENVLAGTREGVGPSQARKTAADDDRSDQDQNSRRARARSSRAERKVGSSFKPGVRRKCSIPTLFASSPKSWSIS